MTRFRNVGCGLDLGAGDAAVADDALSDAGKAALGTATRIAREDGAHLHLVHALDLDPSALWIVVREQAAGRRTVLDRAKDRLEALAEAPRGFGIETTTEVTAAAPADALLDDAERSGRDLVVVGTRE